MALYVPTRTQRARPDNPDGLQSHHQPLGVCEEALVPSLAVRAELADELLGALDDGVAARLEHLARIVALALLILASLDVLTNALGKDDLEVSVDVNLADAHGDGLLDLVDGDAGAAVENEGQVAGLGLDGGELVEGEALPVGRVEAVDVADAAGEEVNAEVSNLLALIGVYTSAASRFTRATT